MESSSTSAIVDALTRAIVEHRLQPGTKLAEQKLADHFGVSRTLVRQALFQLAQNRLVTLEPARGAFVSTPSVEEARQVFAVRRMLETEMTRAFVQSVTPAKIKALRERLQLSQAVLASVLNTSASTVRKWEVGDKRPSGPSQKLLDIIERKGLEAVL